MSDAVVVIGAGGHAKVCVDTLRAAGHEVAYCIGTPTDSPTCLDVRVVVGDHQIETLYAEGFRNAFVAIGANHIRAQLADDLLKTGYSLVRAVHPSAIVAGSVSIGPGAIVMAGAVIQPATTIGPLAIINTAATIDHDCTIGGSAHIAPQCALAGNVAVGDLSFLGIGAKVIPGIRIGQGVTIGAGAAVISNIKDGVTAVGVPARPIPTA
jgi:UDP-perosamine 4-acetyltransferase